MLNFFKFIFAFLASFSGQLPHSASVICVFHSYASLCRFILSQNSINYLRWMLWINLRLSHTAIFGPTGDDMMMSILPKKKMVFSDEAHFHFSGYVNKQKTHRYAHYTWVFGKTEALLAHVSLKIEALIASW